MGDLVRRIQRRCVFLRPTNPERVLFEECIQALTDVSVQLAEAKTVYVESNGFTITRAAEDPTNGEETPTAHD